LQLESSLYVTFVWFLLFFGSRIYFSYSPKRKLPLSTTSQNGFFWKLNINFVWKFKLFSKTPFNVMGPW